MRCVARASFAFLIFTIGPVTAHSPQYQYGRSLQEECPQGRVIRQKQGFYPPTMTDCQVLDADTALENEKLRKKAALRPGRPGATKPVPAVVAAPVPIQAPTQATAVSPSVAPAVAASRPVPAPEQVSPAEQERAFLEVIDLARIAYAAGSNDMAKGAARPARAKGICSVIKRAAIQGWTGEVEQLTSNSDGFGVMSIRIGKDVFVRTWNNSISDIGTHTLIDPDSTVFKKAVALHVGQKVNFSGIFFSSPTDCVREGSLTMDGSLTRPEFIFKFDDVSDGDRASISAINNAEETKSDPNPKAACIQTLKTHGFLSRAQFQCGFGKYAASMIEAARDCKANLGDLEMKDALAFGMTSFDQNEREKGHAALCDDVLAKFPTLLAR